jgi:hypothetical protein
MVTILDGERHAGSVPERVTPEAVVGLAAREEEQHGPRSAVAQRVEAGRGRRVGDVTRRARLRRARQGPAGLGDRRRARFRLP